MIVRSMDNTIHTREYKDDIVQIIQSAFEPQAKNAYAEIAGIIIKNLRSAETELSSSHSYP